MGKGRYANMSDLSLIPISSWDATELTDDELWDRIGPDGCDKSNSHLPDDWVYLAFVSKQDGIIGFWIYHYVNDVCINIHINVLKEHRERHAYNCGRVLLNFIKNNLPDVKKINAEIPVCYPGVIHFTKKYGFYVEGINRKSIMKNNKLTDQCLLGLTREELENGRC